MSTNIQHSSVSVEWYTPARYVEAAREVMGGIDLDPASCEVANRTVKAARYYTEQENGLLQPWGGRVWLNPPYGHTTGQSNQGIWTRRLIDQYEQHITTEAVLLVNAATDTTWFQLLWNYHVCFTDHRIHFNTPDGASMQPTHGNVLVYFGPKRARFIDVFTPFGVIASRESAASQATGVTLELWTEAS